MIIPARTAELYIYPNTVTLTELISENAPNLRTVILVRISELGSARTELPQQVRT